MLFFFAATSESFLKNEYELLVHYFLAKVYFDVKFTACDIKNITALTRTSRAKLAPFCFFSVPWFIMFTNFTLSHGCVYKLLGFSLGKLCLTRKLSIVSFYIYAKIVFFRNTILEYGWLLTSL